MTTDFRALCAELLEWAERTSSHYYKQADVIIRARAALAEPELEGPTLAELDDLCEEHCFNCEDRESLECLLSVITDALARWGRPVADESSVAQPADGEVAELVAWLYAMRDLAGEHNPDEQRRYTRAADLLERLSPPQPVPVSERLPGPEDCDAEGNVWAWRRFDSEDMDNGDFWCLAFCEWLEDEDCNFTHWLPANALPTPESND